MKNALLFSSLLVVLLMGACKPGFQPIDYGKDNCAHCKMTIMEKQYASELVDKKGKAFKFDDIVCMKDYVKEKNLTDDDLMLFVANYKEPDSSFLDVRKAFLMYSENFKSPMNGHVAAFSSEEQATAIQQQIKGRKTDWNELK